MTLHERKKVVSLASLVVGTRFKHLPFSGLFHSLFRSGLILKEVSLEGSDLNEFISQA